MLGRGLILVAVGLALGVLGASALMSIVPPALAPNVNVRDPLTFAFTATLLAGVAAVASLIPAYRATRIDPLRALRTE
jgi:ABC-type antimicrobial peptide transport system permease subunit